MPRINPTVSKEASEIYNNWNLKDRGHNVSQAIINYAKGEYITREEYNSLLNRVKALEERSKL